MTAAVPTKVVETFAARLDEHDRRRREAERVLVADVAGPTPRREPRGRTAATAGGARSGDDTRGAPEAVERRSGGADGNQATTRLPPSFWAARPVLGHIRQAAHARQRSADAVLLAVLVRVASCTPHDLVLPPIVGAHGSLNLCGTIIARSGAGKSTAVAIAAELVPVPAPLDVAEVALGSGEGIAETYMGTVTEKDDDGKTHRVRRQVRWNACFYVDEGETVLATMERKGSTTMQTLRTAWSGGTLGQQNGTAERTRVIPAHQYRFGLVVGFQPTKAGALLADAAGGTPQRFLWFTANDPTIPDTLPRWPGPIGWQGVDPVALDGRRDSSGGGYRRAVLGVPDEIVAEVRADDLARQRGAAIGDPLDAHAMLHRLKLAAVLAVLDGRLGLDAEDWRLAGILWGTSCAVRTWTAAQVAAEAAMEETRRTRLAAERAVVVTAATASAATKVQRLADRIGKWAHSQAAAGETPDGGWAARHLQHRLSSVEKALFPEVLDAVLNAGYLVVTEDDRYIPGAVRPA